MTAGGGQWAEAEVGVTLNWDNVEGELRQRLEQASAKAAAAVRKNWAKLYIATRKAFDRMAMAFANAMSDMETRAQRAAQNINRSLSTIRSPRLTLRIDTSDALRDAKAAHRAMQTWLNANPLIVRLSVQPDMSQLRGVHIQMQSWLLRNPLRLNLNMDRGINVGRVGRSLLGLGSTIAKFTTIAGAATVAIGGMLPALAALGAATGAGLFGAAVAGAGAFAAGLTAIAAITATVKTAFAGVGDALKNAFDPENAEKFAEAMAKLTPEAQASVRAIQTLGKEFKAVVQQPVQSAMFAGLAPQIAELQRQLVPVRDMMLSVADGFNEGAKSALGFINSARGTRVVGDLLREAGNMGANVGSALGNLVPGILAIGAGASQVFGPMTNGIAGAARELSNMLVAAQQSGAMGEFFRDAIDLAKQLWFVIQQVGGIISAVFSAAAAAGDGVLGGMAEKLQQINAYLSAGEGRDALIQFFTAMQSAVATVLPIVMQLATIIGTTVAPALAGLIVQIGPSISGLVDMLGQGMANLAPAMQPLGAAISAIASAIGPVLPVLGTLLATFAQLAGPIIGALAQALGPVLVTVGQSLITILQALMPAVQPLSQLFVALGPVIGQLAQLLAGALVGALNVAVPVFVMLVNAATAIIPVVVGLLQMLQPLAPVIGGIAAAIGVLVLGFKALAVVRAIITGIQIAWQLLSLAFALSPIGLIITAVVALIGALALFFTKTELGQQIWDKIWTAIKATWDVVWTGLKAGFDAVAAAAMWLWNNAIKPAFTGIGFVFQALWAAVKIYFAVWKTLFQAAGAVVMWLWNNAIKPAFQFIGQIIGAIWNGVVKPVFDLFMGGLRAVGDAALWLWNNAIKPAWESIQGAIEKVWNFVKPIFGKIGDAFRTMGDVAGRIGGAIKDAFSGVVDVIKAPIHAIGRLLASLPDSILGVDIPGVGAIKSWGQTLQGLRDGGPVQMKLQAFASGSNGPIRGPGTTTSDSILARLSRGEYVLPALAVNARTLPFIEALRAGWVPPAGLLGALPGFAAGGPLLTPDEVSRMGGGTVNKSLAEAVRRKFPDVAITSAKTDHDDDGGYHPRGMALDLDNRDDVAAWLFANRKALGLGQIIYGGGDGQWNYYNIGGTEAAGKDAIPIYGSDVVFGQHSNHIHVMANKEVAPTALGGAPVPGYDGGLGGGAGAAAPGAAGGASTPIGSGLGSSWGNAGGQSKYATADEADKGGVIPVWVENWPAAIGGGGGGLGATPMGAEAGLGAVPPADAAGAAVPAGAGVGKLTRSSSKDEVGEAIYWEARKRGYSHDEAVAIISTGLQESGLSPTAIGGGGAWHGVYQQDTSYPGRDDPNKNIAEFFNRLDKKRKGPGASQDMWKNIFWLQQAPGIDTAEGAYSGGRQAYLTEIQSQQAEAKRIADAAAAKAPKAPAPAPAPTEANPMPVAVTNTPEVAPVDPAGSAAPAAAEGPKRPTMAAITLGGSPISGQVGGAVKNASQFGIDAWLFDNPGLLGKFDNSKAKTSLGTRFGDVASSAVGGQLGAALGIFGLDMQPPVVDAIGQYITDNPLTTAPANGEQPATQKNLVDLAHAIIQGQPLQVIVNNPQNGDEVVRKVDQDRRRRMRRYVK